MAPGALAGNTLVTQRHGRVLQDGPPERQSVRLRERVSGLLCWYHTAMEGLEYIFVLRLPLGTLGALTWLQNHSLPKKHITIAASRVSFLILDRQGYHTNQCLHYYTHTLLSRPTQILTILLAISLPEPRSYSSPYPPGCLTRSGRLGLKAPPPISITTSY
jgi:hypothetical protein